MANNVSVLRFRALTTALKQEVFNDAVAELKVQADGLVSLMESVVPVAKGDLEISIRKVDGKSPTQVRIVAGGKGTIKTSPSGSSYDHARAVEFGTVNMKAEPFFFPSYRLAKKKMISSMKRKLTATIKKRSAE
jgi:HK97 gp10 family phage protein